MGVSRMECIDFDRYEQNDRMYGGLSGAKIGICYHGANYILKYPQNLKERHFNNVAMSYSTSPISEYLGSHIYELFDLPVHETLLGMRRGKPVVACRDFLGQGDRLFEFREIKTTFESPGGEISGSETSGSGVELCDILRVIDEHPLLRRVPGVKERFWQMFVVDAYIGNMDRNNGNWGVISRYDGQIELAPVYDNGACLNNKWDEARIRPILDDASKMRAQAYRGVVNIFEQNGKRINPFQYIAEMRNEDCARAVALLVPKMQMHDAAIHALIDEVPVLTSVQRDFLHRILSLRLHESLVPVYEQITKGEDGHVH